MARPFSIAAVLICSAAQALALPHVYVIDPMTWSVWEAPVPEEQHSNKTESSEAQVPTSSLAASLGREVATKLVAEALWHLATSPQVQAQVMKAGSELGKAAMDVEQKLKAELLEAERATDPQIKELEARFVAAAASAGVAGADIERRLKAQVMEAGSKLGKAAMDVEQELKAELLEAERAADPQIKELEARFVAAAASAGVAGADIERRLKAQAMKAGSEMLRGAAAATRDLEHEVMVMEHQAMVELEAVAGAAASKLEHRLVDLAVDLAEETAKAEKQLPCKISELKRNLRFHGASPPEESSKSKRQRLLYVVHFLTLWAGAFMVALAYDFMLLRRRIAQAQRLQLVALKPSSSGGAGDGDDQAVSPSGASGGSSPNGAGKGDHNASPKSPAKGDGNASPNSGGQPAPFQNGPQAWPAPPAQRRLLVRHRTTKQANQAQRASSLDRLKVEIMLRQAVPRRGKQQAPPPEKVPLVSPRTPRTPRTMLLRPGLKKLRTG